MKRTRILVKRPVATSRVGKSRILSSDDVKKIEKKHEDILREFTLRFNDKRKSRIKIIDTKGVLDRIFN